ncbi:ABC transporter permease [Bradyrhizobium sp. 61]|uniref:ABC transporter permease n=1 Tax=unclassified Bradyrhizobium TaxID=2631580 RepID=UPI001FF8FD58|nr:MULTISPECIES: ABC transporter permease [unclassified Bradyrhizobium]MCK1274666.1 ABC transporter permease [Bradyrhizobium sp. 61]MCK1441660.1 ABC transporter permease [Bradyrhizobium sp. 48]MCK1465202.1 ABC transporter permease [Bradyrhizobium sp. 2]
MTSTSDFISDRAFLPSQLWRGVANVTVLARSVPSSVYLAAAIILLYVLAALAPTLLQTHAPFRTDLNATLQSPSFAHLFGTDQSGRDLYSRVIEGTRQSLAIGVGATTLSMTLALIFGVSAGLAGGAVDGTISRFLEVLFAFPNLFLGLLLITVFEATTTTLIIAVGVGTAPGYARMIRGQFLTVKHAGYVEAARALGHSYWRIVRRHIFPNAMRPLVAMITLGLGQSIVWASSLAFLGLGVAPPSPEWGALLDGGRQYVTRAWWLEVMPGLAIIVFALAVTAIGRYLQQRLEGRARAL